MVGCALPPQTDPKGFTLIELLVVIAVIAVLMAILMPALQRAKRQASAINCMANVKTLATGWYMYATDHDGRIMSCLMDARTSNGTVFGWIGLSPWHTRPFTGLIDDVRIYSRPLSAAEVAGLVGRTIPLHKPF